MGNLQKDKRERAGAKALSQHEIDAQLIREKTARLRALRLGSRGRQQRCCQYCRWWRNRRGRAPCGQEKGRQVRRQGRFPVGLAGHAAKRRAARLRL